MTQFSIYALLNSEVTAPMFTKFLHELEALFLLLKHAFTRRQDSQGHTAFPVRTTEQIV